MIYLNHSATSYPKPEKVEEAVHTCITSVPASQFRGGEEIGKEDITDICRRNLGKILGVSETDRIFFSSGATEAMNIVLCGLWKEDGTSKDILVTQTEHNSVLRPILNQAKFRNTKMLVVPCEPDGSVTREALEKTVTEKSAILVVNHCSNVTGKIQDMEMMGQFARQHNLLLVVDVSQSAGAIALDIEDWGAAAAVFTGHKALLGIQGTGGYYIRKDVEFHPFLYGGTGRNSAQLTYENGDFEYEVGTQNLVGITALNAGIEEILQTGIQQIEQKEWELMDRMYSGLQEIVGVIIYGSHNSCKGPVLSMNFEGMKASDAAYILKEGFGIIVRSGLHCAPLIHNAMGTQETGTVRVSISWLTKETEIDAFLEAVRQISASIRVND